MTLKMPRCFFLGFTITTRLRRCPIATKQETILVSNVCEAFKEESLGTKVVNQQEFMHGLFKALDRFDWSTCRQPGQAFLPLGEELFKTVSAGVGKRTSNPEDYVLREHRGRVGAYLSREHAAPVESLAVILYTAEAYFEDPEVGEEEKARLNPHNPDYVIVAVLAAAGPRPPLTPHRLVSNLAGGNREAYLWDADEIRLRAKESSEYDNDWCVVSD